MSTFQSSLDAFFQGKISLPDLEQALEGADTVPGAREDIVAILDKSFASGRLPAQIYHSLRIRLHPDAAVGRVQVRPAVTRPENVAFDAQTERTVKEIREKTAVRFEMDGTRIVADATVRVPPLDPGQRSENESLSKEARPTGSNWGRPDQWRENKPGPVGPGSVINNRFIIESQLGKGGMGVVFEARDLRKEEAQDSDPYVAIKILNDEFRNHPQALMALQREASKAQTLAHPNIITVYDFDRDGTTVYMTMELMRGESLSERIRKYRRGGAPRDEAVPIILEMAAGLAYAHKRDIVHSDFKPGNVFLTDDNRVKVLDFGIARATQYTGNTKSSKTVFDAGELGALTPGYASLEMLNGEPPHPADDVYALAITAYQLLTGVHPFKRLTAAEALEQRLKPDSIKVLKRREWKTIARGLEFRRKDRIQDAGSFLRQFRGATPVTRSAAATIVVLLGLSVYFAIPGDPKPLFPESGLSSDVRAQLYREIDDGNFYLQNGQPGFAFEHFHRAFGIHLNNPNALKGLKAVADTTIESAAAIQSDKERRDKLKEIETYSVNEYLAEHKRLQKTRERLVRETNTP